MQACWSGREIATVRIPVERVGDMAESVASG